MEVTFFAEPASFRAWLGANHAVEKELLVGFYKVGSGKPSMTWSQSVDQALCFGWIDGVRKSIDSYSYSIRFTPRKPGSIWSTVNIQKVEVLSRQGLMHAAGIASFQKRTESRSSIYSHEIEEVKLTEEFEALFRANEKAWTFFQSLGASYRKASLNWVMGAKQAATQAKRLSTLISESAAGTNPWKDNKYMKRSR